ncbi:AlbA family DNA-binding domain-containing protein [Sulfurimonas sp.]|uniref:AlbA family DNA-binding domain-containing protein n=1 Tax=Sulfurimonas sp. TaxID=2022749 RepID=UPI003D0B776A
MNKKLLDIVKGLIALKKEGVYWDFKQEHHQNNVDFIHDVICLANARNDGDRYLIFGVDDNSKIIELSNFKKQADIVDTLRNAHFADDIFPDITLEDLVIDDKTIQVLRIKNTSNKPYYLRQEKKDHKKTINAGTVYTRVMDTNTPKNRVASSKDIEYMWKERFGLIQTPLERFKIYLEDFKGWQHSGEISHYGQFPEFTIQSLEDSYCQGAEKLEWARGEIGYHYNSGNVVSVFGFYYYSTLLKKLCCVQFDGGKKYIVNPDWEAIGKGRIYFYLEDSFEYAYQKFLTEEREEDFSKQIRSTASSNFDIPVFSSKNKLQNFLIEAKKQFSHDDSNSPETNEKEQNILFYSYLNFYKKWLNLSTL